MIPTIAVGDIVVHRRGKFSGVVRRVRQSSLGVYGKVQIIDGKQSGNYPDTVNVHEDRIYTISAESVGEHGQHYRSITDERRLYISLITWSSLRQSVVIILKYSTEHYDYRLKEITVVDFLNKYYPIY